jgi:anti-sigma factor RsiW
MGDSQKYEENLTAYLDGELSEVEVKELEAALAKDASLRATLDSLRGALSAMKSMPEPAASAALRRAVLEKVEGPQSFGERMKLFFTLPRLIPVAGLAAAAALAVVVSSRGGGLDKPPADPEQLYVAQNMDLLEDMELIGLEHPDDLDVVMNLDALEATP